jgi:hypothetical protein
MEYASEAALVAVATGIALTGARRAYKEERRALVSSASVADSPTSSSAPAPAPAHTITAAHAMLAPLFAAAVLLVVYFAMQTAQTVVVLYTVLVSVVSVAFVLQGSFTSPGPLPVLLALLLACAFLATNHPLFIDAIASCTAITIVASMRLPSLRVATILFAGLFIYDAVFVFVPFVRGKDGEDASVMVEVAKQQPTNPMHTLVKATLPSSLADALAPPSLLDMPNKLLFPSYAYVPAGQRAFLGEVEVTPEGGGGGAVFVGFLMLGLGDIALPGLLLALAYRLDRDKERESERDGEGEGGADDVDVDGEVGATTDEAGQEPRAGEAVSLRVRTRFPASPSPDSVRGASPSRRGLSSRVSEWAKDLAWGVTRGYTRTLTAAYVGGLVVCFVAMRVWAVPQPALIYLVPSTVGSMAAHAWMAGRGDREKGVGGVGGVGGEGNGKRRREWERVWMGPAAPGRAGTGTGVTLPWGSV